ncbi:MAG: glycyl-radical enzyme activating protein [Armatimonadota bacterium]
MTQPDGGPEGLVFDIDTFAVHDGPGIRMAVYLKGCPLACKWCHSPESLRPEPELILVRDRCTVCGACVAVCSENAHRIDDGAHLIDRSVCVVCGRCVERCPHGALAIKGRRMSAADVVRKATRLKPFFDHSDGGVTLTGGEVTAQAAFGSAILEGCQAGGIHTAIETSGACAWERLEPLLEHTDLVLYDIKLADDEAHRRWTGVSNRDILDNASRLAELERDAGPTVQVRIPLIPNITDTDENLRAILTVMREVRLSSVALLPYNPSSSAKYEWLDLPYTIAGEPQSAERLDGLLSLARDFGLRARIA